MQTVAGDRVLLVGQTDVRDNGIWVVDTGPWRRAKDFNKTRDVVKGTRVWAVDGDSGPVEWEVASENPDVIGAASIEFEIAISASIAATLAQAPIEVDNAADRAEAVAAGAVGDQFPETVTASTYSPVLADANFKLERLNDPTGVALTITYSMFGIGETFAFEQVGAGPVTITGASGVTITTVAGQAATSSGPGAIFQLMKSPPVNGYCSARYYQPRSATWPGRRKSI